MSEPIAGSMPHQLDIDDGYTLRWSAVDPTSGADVSGVVVTDASVQGALGAGSVVPAQQHLTAQTQTAPPATPAGQPPPRVLASVLMADFQTFVTDVEKSSAFTTWAKSQPADAATWNTYSRAILAGQVPATPAMTSPFGVALVDVGVLALDAAGTPPGGGGTTGGGGGDNGGGGSGGTTAGSFAFDATAATVAPDSAAVISKLFTYAGTWAFLSPEVGIGEIPQGDTEAYPVSTAGKKHGLDATVYFPPDILPGISYDHHLTVLDRERNRQHDLELYQQTTPDAPQWVVNGKVVGWTNGNSSPLGSIQEQGVGSSNAAKLALTAGALTMDDFLPGATPHSLVFSCSAVGSAKPVYPSPALSGETTPGNIPLGQWLRLAPDAVLGSGATMYERVIFDFLQACGMFLRDQGAVKAGTGDVTLHALDPGGGGRSFPAWRTAGVPLNAKGVVHLGSAIPWHKLQALQPPAPIS